MSSELRLAGLRYVDPEPPDFPANMAWNHWKIRDDARRATLQSAGPGRSLVEPSLSSAPDPALLRT